ncbi:uncharacterized protein KY384_002386 [Bacidia gigantensis]|uniref:uncharacterized protein n=1 Tax=Bacidia gigantensis TaxID=2732470 RepID=UPI001D04AAE8|nr:uncharacterized protein KY384_002386 [Bacidia gigantensis]KAG8532509.1 hypothetical protein KY384_002386 [Bacidia gigantensis]
MPLIPRARYTDESRFTLETYNYSKLPNGCIRLLRRVPNSRPAVYTLEEVDTFRLVDDPNWIVSAVKYCVISYVRGSSALTHFIICNDRKLAVPCSVYELLLDISEASVWIDAICINQADSKEKAASVDLMEMIYGKANLLYVWLGPGSYDSPLAMISLKKLASRVLHETDESLEQPYFDPQPAQAIGLETGDARIKRALEHLYCRPWFKRLWTFQEIVMGRNVVVACGREMMGWSSFIVATRALSRLRSTRYLVKLREDGSGNVSILDGILEMEDFIRLYRDKTQVWDGAPNFVTLLEVAQRKDVSDPRDKIYAILNLARPNIRRRILIEYRHEGEAALLRLIIDAGKACIDNDNTLSLLQLVSSTKRNPRLPSWCPDINSTQPRNMSLNPWGMAGIKEWGLQERPCASFQEGKDDLHAPGFRLDKVARVVQTSFVWSNTCLDAEHPSREDAIHNFEWIYECMDFELLENVAQKPIAKKARRSLEEIPLTFILTLIGGILVGNSNTESEIRAAYKRIISIWRSVFLGLRRKPLTLLENATVNRLQAGLMQNCRYRRVFSTQDGYIGVGPPDTMAGDTICILYGSRTPHLLRFGKSKTELLGDVYLTECMCLEDTVTRGVKLPQMRCL